MIVKKPLITLKELTAKAAIAALAVNFFKIFTPALTKSIDCRIMEQGIWPILLTKLTPLIIIIFFLINLSYNINVTSGTDEGVAQRGRHHEIHN